MGSPVVMLFLVLAGLVALGLFIGFVMVPLFRGIGMAIGGVFTGIGWLIAHLFEFIGGIITDTVRFVGAIIAFGVLGVLAVLSVIIGRWSAAGHFASAAKGECHVGSACVYRVLLRRPLKLFWLHGLLEGLEQRLPEAMNAAPTADVPSKHTGKFEGYEIVGSLRAGGSGAKLYVAEPSPTKRGQMPGLPERVVIKSFALTDGSTLPQIVRESRALECAKSLGHVVDHGMSDQRFFYVMPFIPGDHLGIKTRQFHGASDGAGLSDALLRDVMTYVADLLATLEAFHWAGFWHKDVKPENVIVHDERAHLVDLGLVTSLQSAMTLTTHGTEYFRDPEMVRLALRGVKVHQVDGAKFDIYGVGAVTYFVLENTFPAHGGLSAFQKRAPEALRWIVRRAMADYQQRYESAAAMRRDLEFVRAARDPFAVKPAQLPSMRGAGVEESVPAHAETRDAKVAAAAGSPAPPQPAAARSWGIAFGPAFVSATLGLSPRSPADPVAARPQLKVTNWWTGSYRLADAAGATVNPRGLGAREAAQAAASSRMAVQSARRAARDAVRSSRRSAKEQLVSARTRAADLRRRAAAARPYHRSVKERQPSGALVGVTVVMLLIGGAIFMMLTSNKSAQRQHDEAVAALAGMNNPALVELSDGLIDRIRMSVSGQDAPAVFVLDASPGGKTWEVNRELHQTIAARLKDFRIVSESVPQEDGESLLRGNRIASPAVAVRVEQLASRHGCQAVLVFTGESPNPYLVWKLPLGDQAGAAESSDAIPTSALAARGGALVLINDHPAAASDAVIEQLEALRLEYEAAGCRFVEPPAEAMAELVVLLQRARLDPAGPAEAELRDKLAKLELAGLVHVVAEQGEQGQAGAATATLLLAEPATEAATGAEDGADGPRPATEGPPSPRTSSAKSLSLWGLPALRLAA